MKKDTVLVNVGRSPEDNYGIVNTPIYRASTVTHPTMAAYEEAAKTPFEGVVYGRLGTPTTFAFEEAVAELEGGYRCVSVSSGLAAIAVSMFAFLKNGEHVLVPDNAYGPTRLRVCDGLLARAGIETTYYDPSVGAEIKELMQPNTAVVYLESPGSLTFEVQDVAVIAAAAHDNGALVMIDNTWATPLFFKPLSHGVDLVIEAATKYIVGHADAMLGAITVSTKENFEQVKWTANALGNCAGPDDCYLGLRGLRTMSVRLERHQKNALVLARWLQERPEVDRVLYPALPGNPAHDLWKHYYSGASGLFGVVLKKFSKKAVAAMLDGLELFSMGASWGGYESLILPTDPVKTRTATTWTAPGPSLRIHAGLEDSDDLIADLEAGFKRLNETAKDK